MCLIELSSFRLQEILIGQNQLLLISNFLSFSSQKHSKTLGLDELLMVSLNGEISYLQQFVRWILSFISKLKKSHSFFCEEHQTNFHTRNIQSRGRTNPHGSSDQLKKVSDDCDAFLWELLTLFKIPLKH